MSLDEDLISSYTFNKTRGSKHAQQYLIRKLWFLLYHDDVIKWK